MFAIFLIKYNNKKKANIRQKAISIVHNCHFPRNLITSQSIAFPLTSPSVPKNAFK